MPLWALAWINIVNNFPTAGWYVHRGIGMWSTSELRIHLKNSVPRLANYTISNAIMELAGLLEHTPIGDDLGQGIVEGGRPRLIKRIGTEPCDAAILYAFGRLYVSYGKPFLPFNASLTWPWIIFGCDKKFVLERLVVVEVQREGIVICNTNREGWLCGNTIISYL